MPHIIVKKGWQVLLFKKMHLSFKCYKLYINIFFLFELKQYQKQIIMA